METESEGDRMKTRSVLAYLPGMPLKTESLLPRRELAAMAGALQSAGHETHVVDYGTVWAVRRFVSGGLGAAVRQGERGGGAGVRMAMGDGVTRRPFGAALEGLVQESIRRRRREMISELLSAGAVDFMVFLADDELDFREALSVCREVREQQPAVRTAVAGRHARDYGAILLGVSGVFDAAIEGDEEIVVPEWASQIRQESKWASVPGLLYLDAGRPRRGAGHNGISLDTLPMPCYDASTYPAVHGDGKFLLFTVDQTRGALHVAHGDRRPGHGGGSLRMKSPAAACAEAALLTRQFGVFTFHIRGSETPGGQLIGLAKEVGAQRWRMQYSLYGAIRHAEEAAASALASSGCRSICFSVDTGSQRLLEDFYGRNFSVSEIERVVCAYRKAGIFVTLRCTFPCPMDDYHTRAETLRLLIRSRPGAVRFAPPRLKPDSVWMHRAPEFGYRINHDYFPLWAIGQDAPYVSLADPIPVLPYRMTGWSRGRMTMEHADLLHDIIELGICPGGTAQEFLMARVSGYEGDEETFYRRLREVLATLDASALAKMTTTFNERAGIALESAAFRRFASTLAAVGN